MKTHLEDYQFFIQISYKYNNHYFHCMLLMLEMFINSTFSAHLL